MENFDFYLDELPLDMLRNPYRTKIRKILNPIKKIGLTFYYIGKSFSYDGRRYFGWYPQQYIGSPIYGIVASMGDLVIHFHWLKNVGWNNTKPTLTFDMRIGFINYYFSELFGFTQFGNIWFFFDTNRIKRLRYFQWNWFNIYRWFKVYKTKKGLLKEIAELEESCSLICNDPMCGCPEDFAWDFGRKIRSKEADYEYLKYFPYKH